MPVPQTVKDLARSRPIFGNPRPASPFPLVNADGKTWAQVRAERDGGAA